MSDQIKIPKFRSTRRLIAWLSNNSSVGRLPSDIEEIFFTTKKEPLDIVAGHVATYANYVGRLGTRFENLVLGANSPSSLFSYCTALLRRGDEVPPELIDGFKGASGYLYKWAQYTKQRLPQHLEDSMTEPRSCFLYAREVLRGRLPKHLESVFLKDAEFAVKYAFEIIRGYAPVKLPEELHSFLILKSFEEPNNESIKSYMQASESDPDQMGNLVFGCRP